VTVHAQNGGVSGSDPAALAMLQAGEVEFATFMGPLLANIHPLAEVQGVPFAFSDSHAAHRAVDGPLGDYLREELATKGLYLVPAGALENGVRHICSVRRRVTGLGDLEGYRMRVPATRIIRDCFDALGCETVTVNVADLGAALAERRVDGHENPLAIVDANDLTRLTASIARSGHIWSAFNLVANLAFWQRLTESMQAAIHAATRTHVARQRAETVALNTRLEEEFAHRGIEFTTIDRAAVRARLGLGFYARTREICGERAWGLLQDAVGPLG
jgi:TRAP-type transport system periplasmic protein